jgi:hypothetical protein
MTSGKRRDPEQELKEANDYVRSRDWPSLDPAVSEQSKADADHRSGMEDAE